MYTEGRVREGEKREKGKRDKGRRDRHKPAPIDLHIYYAVT